MTQKRYTCFTIIRSVKTSHYDVKGWHENIFSRLFTLKAFVKIMSDKTGHFL